MRMPFGHAVLARTIAVGAEWVSGVEPQRGNEALASGWSSGDHTMSSNIAVCPACAAKNQVAPSAIGIPHCAKCGQVLPWLVDVHDNDFATVVGESSLPVLVDLWAPWCGPCHMVAPHVAESASQFAGRLKVAKLNVDESPRIAGTFGVQGIPTLILTQKGKEIGRTVGALLGDALTQWIDKTLHTVNA